MNDHETCMATFGISQADYDHIDRTVRASYVDNAEFRAEVNKDFNGDLETAVAFFAADAGSQFKLMAPKLGRRE